MKQKNLYFYTNLLAWGLVLFLIGNYVFGWTTPTATPPSSNLPAPINVGPDPQTKSGNLTIGGNLTTGGFKMTTGAGADKVLTTDTSGVATWQAAAGGGWDGVLPNYTTAQRNDLSLVDGLIVYNTTDNAVQIYKSGAWANVGAKLSLAAVCSLDGDCDSTHCVDGVCCDTACSGTVCQTCGALSSASIGHCGYVNSSTVDPDNDCGTTNCYNGNCKGDGYTCGYYGDDLKHNCSTCYACNASGSCTARTAYYSGATAFGCTVGSEGCRYCSAGTCTYYTSLQRGCATGRFCISSGICCKCTPTCGWYCCSAGYACANCTNCECGSYTAGPVADYGCD